MQQQQMQQRGQPAVLYWPQQPMAHPQYPQQMAAMAYGQPQDPPPSYGSPPPPAYGGVAYALSNNPPSASASSEGVQRAPQAGVPWEEVRKTLS